MTEFVLVRHPETVWHAENRYAGRSDVALTTTGHDQAATLGAWARDAGLAGVVTSPLRRARETAEAVASAAGVRCEIDPRLVEVDFGAGDGLTRAEMCERFPDALAAFLDRPASCPLPGAEAGTDAVARARPALLERAAGPGPVLVVGHQTLFRLLLCGLLGVPLDRYRAVLPRLDNVALTRVGLAGDGTAALMALNVPLRAAAR